MQAAAVNAPFTNDDVDGLTVFPWVAQNLDAPVPTAVVSGHSC